METQNKYQNGKIYTIRHPDSEKYYIGSTCEKYISNRFGGHKSNYKKYLNGKYSNVSSFRLFDLGIDECYIELLELFPCSSKMELTKREGELIRLYKNDVVNKRIAGVTKEAKKEHKKEYMIEYNEANKEVKKQYYQTNKEQILEKQKIKYTCECGSQLRKRDKLIHDKTKKHINFINQNNI